MTLLKDTTEVRPDGATLTFRRAEVMKEDIVQLKTGHLSVPQAVGTPRGELNETAMKGQYKTQL